MKYLINLVILAVIGTLGFILYSGIQEPIKFRAEKDRRKNVVVDRLQNIRTAQELYREIKGHYASSFDELIQVLKTDSIPFLQLLADPEDPSNPDKFITNTIYTNALDSINALGINLDEIKFVPYSKNQVEFTMMSDTTTYQKTIVPVMECMTRWDVFMGTYADARFKKYDDSYEPTSRIGFGSMNSPNLEGNWR